MKYFNAFLLVLFYFTCCQNNIDILEGKFTLDQAKEHFLNSTLNAKFKLTPNDNFEMTLNTRTDSFQVVKIPIWEQASYYFDSYTQQEIYEIPLNRNDYMIYRLNGVDTVVQYLDTVYKSLKRLLIIKNSDGSIDYTQLNIIGHEDYLNCGGVLENNNYHYKENAFKGVVFFSDWYDRFEMGYYFASSDLAYQIQSIDNDTTFGNIILRTDCFIKLYFPKHLPGIHCYGDNWWQCLIADLSHWEWGHLDIRINCDPIPGQTGDTGTRGRYTGVRGENGSTGGSGGTSYSNNWRSSYYTNPTPKTIKEIEDHNRDITANKILNCLQSNNTSNTVESILYALDKILGICQTLSPDKKNQLAFRLSITNSSQWKVIIYDFLLQNGFSQTCLKTIFDAVDCQNNSPSECAIKIAEFQNDYGTLGMDEDEFVAFLQSSGCYNNCKELEKCLVTDYFELDDYEWVAFNNKAYYIGPETVVPSKDEQIGFKLCPVSINIEHIQDAFYVKLIDFEYIFKPIFQPFKSYKIKIPEICFQVPNFLNLNFINEGIHYSAEQGIFLTLVELNAKHTRSSPATQAQILIYLKENIKDSFYNYFQNEPGCSFATGSGICPGISGRKTLWCL